MNASNNLAHHPRVQALLAQFRCIDDGMRGLPIYNEKVAIEAIGFRLFGGDALLGVLLTPWFMNLLVLPIERQPLNMAQVGKSVALELPAGERTFVIGGDEVIGLYRAHSLYSPVSSFTLPGQAQAEANRLLALLMTSPTAEPVTADAQPAHGVDRRALLFGRQIVRASRGSI